MRQRIIEAAIIIVLLLALVGGVYWYFANNPQAWGWVLGAWERVLVELELTTPEAERAGITASGFIEVRQVTIAPEVSGRLAHLLVDEGDQVKASQVLAEIDTDLIDSEIAIAEAGVAMAEAQLARVKVGARDEEIAVAEAGVGLAEAQRDAAYQAWQDAILLRDNPQELDLQIAAVRSQITILEHRIQQMAALKDATNLISNLRERQVTIIEEGIDYNFSIPGQGTFSGHFNFPEGEKRQAWAGWNLATTDVWSAWANLNQATAARDAARQKLSDLLAIRENPQQAKVQAAQTEAAYQQAVAGVEVSQANLDIARAGATQEQIEVARTGLSQAQATLKTLEVQRQKYVLRAPLAGLVVERIAHEGEMALPGMAMLTIASLDSVELTIYIPEPDVGKVFLSQPVEVSVDSFSGEIFAGQVVWISDEAEFTPKNIQTKEERVNTVFAVKANIPNPGHKLKPGMPADAVLALQ
ncbi:MAG: efflux RND transporter periplasmic adaptor subunit [Anaerolineales bacterium]|nr:MAG: efflux RND transporter periplasmic adaptor subunit [Anaerolineales bacterium]